MTFLQPLLLLGLLGVAVPILVHLFGRSRAQPKRFPMVALLERAQANPARRLHLRERLLFLARIAIAALLALVLARPAIWTAGGPGAGAKRIAVIVDDSFSMGLEEGGAPIFESARAKARSAVDTALDAGGEAALILGATGSRDPVPRLSRDRGQLTTALAALRASARADDLEAAVQRARAALAGDGRVVVITDGTASIPAGDDIELVDVGEGAAFANVAVTDVEVGPDPGAAPGALRVSVEVSNFTPVARTVTLAPRDDERILSRATLSLGPGERQVKSLSVSPPAGTMAARVTIDADALPIDDSRHFVMTGASDVGVLVVNGDPRPERVMDELFYVRAALDAPGDSEPALRTRTALPEDLAERLAGQNVLLLLNVRSLSSAARKAVLDFVRAGGGVLVSMGGRGDADHPVLPAQSLGAVVTSVWSAGPRGPDEDADRLVRIGEVDLSHPAMAPLAARPHALQSARFWGRVLLSPQGAGARTLMRFQDGAPALLETTVGKGRILVFASTLDRDWSDWVIRPPFPPLLRQWVRHLGRGDGSVSSMHVLAGEPCALGEGEKGVAVRPDGEREPFSGSYARTDVPGVYRLRAEGGSEVACVVNVDPRESALKRVELPEATAAATVDDAARRRANPVAHAFAAVLLAVLLAESLLGRRR